MRQRLGQHFLTRGAVIHKILMNLQLQSNDSVLEIGPGRGALTLPLAKKVAKLLLVEKDPRLFQGMVDRFKDEPQVQILNRDFLDLDKEELRGLLGEEFKVVSNLPYQVSTAILVKLLKEVPLGTSMILMFQKEVADRLLAKPHTKAYGSLTIVVQSLATLRQVCVVPPSAFNPPPNVYSAVLSFRVRETPCLPPAEQDRFEKLLHEGFKQRRKMLRQLLRPSFAGEKAEAVEARLRQVGASEKARAEELSLEQWLALFQQLNPQPS